MLIDQTKAKIPKVDRCKNDVRPLLTVILEIVEGVFFRLGTKTSTRLSQLFTRSQMILCEENF